MTTKHIILLAFACISGFTQMNAMHQVVTSYKRTKPYHRKYVPMTAEQLQQVLARQTEQEKQTEQAEQDKQIIDKLTTLIQDPNIPKQQKIGFEATVQLDPKERATVAKIVLNQWEKNHEPQKSIPTEQQSNIIKTTPQPVEPHILSPLPTTLVGPDRESYYTIIPQDFLMNPTGLKKPFHHSF